MDCFYAEKHTFDIYLLSVRLKIIEQQFLSREKFCFCHLLYEAEVLFLVQLYSFYNISFVC
jgi:hypothetical protein